MNHKEAEKILELSLNWSQDDVKKQFKKLAIKYHPDKNPGDETALKKSKEVSEAYNLLKDFKSSKDVAASQNQPPFRGNPFKGNPFNGGPIGGGFEDFFAHINNHHKQQLKINRMTLELTFEESILGCQKDLKIQAKSECKKCEKDKPCSACEGKKFIFEEDTIKLSVPAGVQDGFVLNIQSEDMIYAVTFKVAPHQKFKRQNDNIFHYEQISLHDALAGCAKKIDTIYGEKNIKIPARSKHKDQIIISNCGIEKRGNHIVILDIEYPSDEDLKKVVEALKKD
jgi:molecular chaperone DnaJ